MIAEESQEPDKREGTRARCEEHESRNNRNRKRGRTRETPDRLSLTYKFHSDGPCSTDLRHSTDPFDDPELRQTRPAVDPRHSLTQGQNRRFRFFVERLVQRLHLLRRTGFQCSRCVRHSHTKGTRETNHDLSCESVVYRTWHLTIRSQRQGCSSSLTLHSHRKSQQ